MMRVVRIGTWNFAGRWSDDHAALLEDTACDVWLLTEVNERTTLGGYSLHPSQTPMADRRHWAAVLSREAMSPLPDPHPASAAVRIGTTTYVSSVLPWRSCGAKPPWIGKDHAARTESAISELASNLGQTQPLVWGGDWNHALTGPEHAGSHSGRRAVLGALKSFGLEAPTADLPHAIDGLLSIDHVAVPVGRRAAASRVSAERSGRRLSDHDAYVVDLDA
ncbi:endonuclease/exonuclease/phosphatase family protein [Nocardioides sediminis]|uniref:endonuclease/exonuclease/phosphatase family protein n=1 Tax=Nocardioides sediminis TaxID=433648 RepID=UPI00131EF08C|nr:endonuclease/exonuclease/phosphatase family protein [Nocardioides sediminis]